MTSGAQNEDLNRVAVFVAAHPGWSRARVAAGLGVRRGPGILDRALEAGVIHQVDIFVRTRGSGIRAARGLKAGPGSLHLVDEVTTGRQLRDLRIAGNVSPGAVAYQLGVTKALMQHWETGRQPVPGWLSSQLDGAIEAAQTPHPRKRKLNRLLRDLLRAVHRQPGVGRYELGAARGRARAVLDQALADQQVHEAPAWTTKTRQPIVGIYPGPRPKDEPMPLLVADLREARLAAGWSHLAMGGHLGIAGTTVARWERDLKEVPGWKAEAAAAAMAAAKAARRDDRGPVLDALTAEPGLSRKALLAHLGYSWHADRVQAELDALITAGLAHERHAGQHGQQRGIYPGPTPAEVLTPEQLTALRISRGLTQRQVAEQLGTHVQAVRDWERSDRPMSIEWQSRLLEHLEAMPDAREQLRCDVLAALPRGLNQLDLLALAGKAELREVLQELVDAGRAHEGLVETVNAAGVSQRRRGYLPGPGT